MPSITISRPKQFGDILRKYKLIIDGEVVAKIKRGETLNIPVEPGPHTLMGKIDWLTTDELSFDASTQTPNFEIRNGLTALHFLLGPLAILFSTRPWIVLDRKGAQ